MTMKRRALLFSGILLLHWGSAPGSFAQPAQSEVDLLIRGGTVVTMDGAGRILEGGAVAIRGDRIVAVLDGSESLPVARETIDASGHLVIPGLVNTHGHVAMTLLRGIADNLKLMDWLSKHIFPAEAHNVSPDFVYWGSLLGCVEMARSGTTTYTDMYYFEDEVARATKKVGLRGVLGQSVIGFPAPDYKTPEEALAGAKRFIERYRNDPLGNPVGRSSRALHHSPRCGGEGPSPRAGLRSPVPNRRGRSPGGERPDRGQARKAHHRSPRRYRRPRSGTILHHAIWLSDEEIQLIAKSGASTSHNPESNMKTASGVARVPDLLAAGVAVGLGTDGPASNNNLDMFEEMDTAAKLHKVFRSDPTVMPAKTVFRMATLGGAKALGIDDRVGSLEVGKLADVVLVDARVPELTPLYDVYSHLVYAAKGGNVSTVVVNGKLIVENHHVVTVDENEVLEKAREWQRRILESLAK